MYRRLMVLSSIILAALFGLSWLGYHSIQIWAQGMEGRRLAEFAAVAEQIRQDVNRKLDEFIHREQQRPYTDYQYYHVPESVVASQQQIPLLRSPLGSALENDLAYGNFQIEPDGKIVTPYYRQQPHEYEQEDLARKASTHLDNIERNVLPVLTSASGTFILPSRAPSAARDEKAGSTGPASSKPAELKIRADRQAKVARYGKGDRSKEFRIESLQKDSQEAQVITQQRSLVASNTLQDVELGGQQLAPTTDALAEQGVASTRLNWREQQAELSADSRRMARARSAPEALSSQSQVEEQTQGADSYSTAPTVATEQPLQDQSETVQIRIEPFVPLVVPGADGEQSLFGGQIFLLRHVQIEDRHLLQGFQLNETNLIEEVMESAGRFMRDGMTFELPQTQPVYGGGDADGEVAYTAILDFGFGDLVLNLKETDPARIAKQIGRLGNVYTAIVAVVFVAVTLALASLWHNIQAQAKLVQKKDDFISAVSHELRTPLTSIRMYSEMLENNWVQSKDKLVEYYRNMRQESERLSRLIENVLDFSRIQRGRKKYTFDVGDVNVCVAEVVEMMKPYATQKGFTIETDFGQPGQAAFDRDAVTQIVVNLLDNAIKYAHTAEDKTIKVRTRTERQFMVIEVEDHGPGVPRRQHKKVFEQFYRCGAEATRETSGTGLGLALVKKFAEAHNGFVEVSKAEPKGAIFRVALTAQA
ncbi:MAG: GHKL domain-containing protein [Phycisphaerales bacterium]|nr:MAG: GHKL domain-containing protein [Phycisphaerales bacterium]